MIKSNLPHKPLILLILHTFVLPSIFCQSLPEIIANESYNQTSYNSTSQIDTDGNENSVNVASKFIKTINYFVNSHQYKNEMNPYFDLIKIVQNHEIEGPKYGGYDTGVAYADFNGDGYIDINLLLNPGQDGDFCEHFMLINNGDDTFSMDNTLITNPDFQTYMSRKTIVGDFNGDGKPDVVRIAGGHDQLRKSNILMSGNDQYTFIELDVVPESQYHGFASGDLDNDGDLDLFFGQPNSGFAMNDGSGNFTWHRVDEKISNYFVDNTEQYGPYGVGTIEILDVNKDGNEDIVIGGEYQKDDPTQPHLGGPTILWGDGSSNYDYNNKTEIWGFGERPMVDGRYVDNNDDFSFADINNDGYLDVVLAYIIQIDNDPNNGGNPSFRSVLQIFKGGVNNEFTDVTNEWTSNPLLVLDFPITWVILRDIDNNGMIDIVESEKVVSRPGGFWGNSIRWEWNGSSFTITVIDTDGDGVNDDIDTCPITPTGETVNSTGCSTTQLSVDDEILDNSLKLYPNPVTNILTIESKNVAISKVEIYSILGKKIKEITSNFGSITTDNLPNGIYSIRIYSEKSSIIRKMIKM